MRLNKKDKDDVLLAIRIALKAEYHSIKHQQQEYYKLVSQNNVKRLENLREKVESL